MYEDITYELLLNRSLARVDPGFDTREGGPIHTPVAATCVELQNMYIALNGLINETFADTASREYLIKRAAERGVIPTKATYAILKGRFNIGVDIGTRFTCESLSYIVIDSINTAENTYKLQCETVGTIGNSTFGNLIPIEYIRGLESAELIELLIPAEDEQETEDLRKDYFNSYDAQPFAGNRAAYKKMFKDDISGVGGIKTYRLGGGKVKIIVITSTWEKPTYEFIDQIQERVDPLQNQGEGIGLAPIDHVVNIYHVNETQINFNLTKITYKEGWNFESCKTYIEGIIDDYFLELRKEWADSENLVVRLSQIKSRLLSVEGIEDPEDAEFDSEVKTIVLDSDNIPIRGAING